MASAIRAEDTWERGSLRFGMRLRLFPEKMPPIPQPPEELSHAASTLHTSTSGGKDGGGTERRVEGTECGPEGCAGDLRSYNDAHVP